MAWYAKVLRYVLVRYVCLTDRRSFREARTIALRGEIIEASTFTNFLLETLGKFRLRVSKPYAGFIKLVYRWKSSHWRNKHQSHQRRHVFAARGRGLPRRPPKAWRKWKPTGGAGRWYNRVA
jgi:hypothetical protein